MTFNAKFMVAKSEGRFPCHESNVSYSGNTGVLDSDIWDSKKERLGGAMASIPGVSAITIEIEAKNKLELYKKIEGWISALEKLKK